MRYVVFVCLFLLAASGQAETPKNSCTDSDINRQWEQILKKYPQDHLILKLSSLREALCNLSREGRLDQETAKFIWEQAVVDALLDRAREEQERRGLLRLFGTF